MSEPAARRPGRPRDPEVDRRIADATVRLMHRGGLEAVTMEAVAEAAGVGKSAIYRRFGDRRELTGAVLVSLRDARMPVAETEDTEAALAAILRSVRSAIEAAGTTTLGSLLVSERDDPDLMEGFREQVVRPGREQGRRVLRAARDRGKLAPGASIDLALQMLVGSFFARHLVGDPFPRGWEEEVAAAVWRSIRA